MKILEITEICISWNLSIFKSVVTGNDKDRGNEKNFNLIAYANG